MKSPEKDSSSEFKEDCNLLPHSISEENFYKIGGIDQWTMIRGEDTVSNPLLIFLHCGPGLSETNLFRFYNADLERFFTVVYWDQRGSGKSFHESIPESTMNVDQFISDLDELVETVLQNIQPTHKKIILLGHGWGSVLGTLYTDKFPEKVAAYVGCGQIGDWQSSEMGSYTYIMKEAERLQLTNMISELMEMGPPPHTLKNSIRQRYLLSEIEGKQTLCARWDAALVNFLVPEGSFWDVLGPSSNQENCIHAMWNEISQINLLKRVPKLNVPSLFFLGRHDHNVPLEASVDYINHLSAPFKQIVWFAKSGNTPFVEESGLFNMSMVKLVRPLGIA